VKWEILNDEHSKSPDEVTALAYLKNALDKLSSWYNCGWNSPNFAAKDAVSV
jgi:hypothetical protein